MALDGVVTAGSDTLSLNKSQCELALGSPVPFQQGLIWSLEAAVVQEVKIFATLLGLLRDNHLKGFVCAVVLSAGCSQSSPPKPRNG